jgi:hypothetical protein
VTDAEPTDAEPVKAFCTELRHLTRRSSLSAVAASRRLHISRSQYYAIINGDVRRPPDWAKVEAILRMCGEDDAAVAAWRRRHDEMVTAYDSRRTERRVTPGPGPASAFSPDRNPAGGSSDGTTTADTTTAGSSPAGTGSPAAAAATSGSTASGSPAGGPTTDGSSAGGPATGGSTESGSSAGGAATTGGTATGGSTESGSSAGGAATTGGTATGGSTVSGSSAGGAATTGGTATGGAAGGSTEDDQFAGNRRGGRRRKLAVAGAVVVLLGAAAVLTTRVWADGEPVTPSPSPSRTATPVALPPLETGGTLGQPIPGVEPEPPLRDDPGQIKACVSPPPPPGTELLTVRREHRAGNNKINHPWWGNAKQVSFNAANATGFDANIAGGTEAVYDVIILHSCIPVQAGRKYVLHFTAAAYQAGKILVRVQDSEHNEEDPNFQKDLQLAPAPQTFDFTFTATRTSNSTELTYQLGGWEDTFRLQVAQVSLKEVA